MFSNPAHVSRGPALSSGTTQSRVGTRASGASRTHKGQTWGQKAVPGRPSSRDSIVLTFFLSCHRHKRFLLYSSACEMWQTGYCLKQMSSCLRMCVCVLHPCILTFLAISERLIDWASPHAERDHEGPGSQRSGKPLTSASLGTHYVAGTMRCRTVM